MCGITPRGDGIAIAQAAASRTDSLRSPAPSSSLPHIEPGGLRRFCRGDIHAGPSTSLTTGTLFLFYEILRAQNGLPWNRIHPDASCMTVLHIDSETLKPAGFVRACSAEKRKA